MQALMESWFAAADRDSEAADELEALEDRPQQDFTRLKVALACIVAAFAMLLLPLLKPAPRLPKPVLLAMAAPIKAAPVAKVQTTKATAKPRGAAKPSRRRH